jgi:hypothetical protein
VINLRFDIGIFSGLYTVCNLKFRIYNQTINTIYRITDHFSVLILIAKMSGRFSNATNIERRNDNKNNKICFNCRRPGHFARDCRAPREVKSNPLAIRKSQNTHVSKRTHVFKEKKPKKKVAWSEEDEVSSSSVAKENHVSNLESFIL